MCILKSTPMLLRGPVKTVLHRFSDGRPRVPFFPPQHNQEWALALGVQLITDMACSRRSAAAVIRTHSPHSDFVVLMSLPISQRSWRLQHGDRVGKDGDESQDVAGTQSVDADGGALLVVGGGARGGSASGGGGSCDSEAVASVHEGGVAHESIDLRLLAGELGLELGDLVCVVVELLVLYQVALVN